MLPIRALCPVKASTSMFISFMLMGMTPAVWAESTTKVRPCSRQIAPISLNRLNRADDVRPVVHDDDARVWAYRLANGVGLDESLSVERQVGGFGAMIANHVVDGPDHGIVFEVGGDDMVALADQPGNRKVERIGHVIAENQALGGVLIATKEFREPLTSFVQQRARLDRQIVAATAGIHTVGPEKLVHELVHALWLGPDGGCVVEVDQSFFHVHSIRKRTGTRTQ